MKTPTKQIYIGAPLEGDEARFLRIFHHDLGERDALILANFFIGPHQIDFLVVTNDVVALLELKNFAGPVFGGENGVWIHQNVAGQRVPYDGNPFSQTLKQKFALSDAMHDFQRKTPGVPNSTNKKFAFDMLAFVCLYPILDSRSRVTVSEYKVAVDGYDHIRTKLQTGHTAFPWDFATWREFARTLGMTPASLAEACDENVHRAARALALYSARLGSTIGDSLPPLLETKDDNCGLRLIARLAERCNWLLLAPTGTAKSFHLEHLTVLLVDSEEEAPILLRAARFEHGSFAAFLQRETAPYFTGDAAELVGSMRRAGKRPVLIVDGLNECSDKAIQDLLRGAQAFVLHYDGRVVLSSQNDIELPSELQSQQIVMPPLNPQVKRAIYAYHAGIEPSDAVDAFCCGFTNAYDLVIAGRCHRIGAPPSTKTNLYDRYVRVSLAGNTISGTAFLRKVAGTMADDLTFSLSRSRFEHLAEEFGREQRVPLPVLDAISRGRMLILSADAVTFEHELLLAYFQAEHLRWRTDDAVALANELQRPRSRKLLEFILPRLTSAEDISTVLAASHDAAFLFRVASGECGVLPQGIILGECHAALNRAFAELITLGADCQSEDASNGRRRLVGVNLTGRTDISERDQLLFTVVGRSLHRPALLQRVLQLLEATQATLLRAIDDASTESRFRADALWGFVLHNAFVLTWPQMALPSGVILAAFRECIRWQRHNERYAPAYLAIRELAIREKPNDIAALCVLDTWSTVTDQRDVADDLRLVEYAWNTGHYTLRIHAMQFVQQLRSFIGERHTDCLPMVRELLRSLHTDNLFESTSLVEAMSVYDALEGLPTTEEALAEMHGVIAGGVFSEENADALMRLSGQTPDQARCSYAFGTIANIFEEPLSEAYYDAYKSLHADERCTLLSLAAMRERESELGTHLPWILSELVELNRETALPVFKRYACLLPILKKTVCPQEDIACYVIALYGCAQWLEVPPDITAGAGPQEQGWNILGQIVFWQCRFGRSALEQTSKLWRGFPNAMIAAGVLFDAVSGNMMIHHQGIAVDFLREWPDEVREIAEIALATPGEAPSLMRHRRDDLRVFLAKTLGAVGMETSLVVLRSVVDDPILGTIAVDAIANIQRRLAATPA